MRVQQAIKKLGLQDFEAVKSIDYLLSTQAKMQEKMSQLTTEHQEKEAQGNWEVAIPSPPSSSHRRSPSSSSISSDIDMDDMK